MRHGIGWDEPTLPKRWKDHPHARVIRLHHPPGTDYGVCWGCGNAIEPPITEPFFCNRGCLCAWDLAVAQERLRECDDTPRTPRPGYPRLPEDPCDT